MGGRASTSKKLAVFRRVELHDLHTIEGVIALSFGNTPKAVRCLTESVKVCQEDDFALATSAIRVPNLTLAEKLLLRGERDAVMGFLVDCQTVWAIYAKQIAIWIDAVNAGVFPGFLASPIVQGLDRHPELKLRMLLARSFFLGDTGIRGSHIGKAKMLAEYKRRMAAAIAGKLETGKN